MNKAFLAFFFALTVLTANAGFLDDFTKTLKKGEAALNKGKDALNKGLGEVEKYVGAADTTINVVKNVVDSITKDVETVSEDVKALAIDIENEFNALYKDGMRIVDATKKFANAGYSEAKSLYTDLSKQLETIITAAQADVTRAVDAAKATIAQLSTDVQITYRDGKLVASRVKDTADLTAIINNVKAQNKEALQKTIDSINAALADANAIIKQAQEYLEKYKVIATSTVSSSSETVKQLVAKMKEFITQAEAKLKAFKTKQEENLKTIVKDVQALFKSTQSILDKAQEAAGRAKDAYDRNEKLVIDGKKTIEDAWSKEGLEKGNKASGELKGVQDVLDNAKTEVEKASDEGQKVVIAVSNAEKTLSAAMNDVIGQVSAIEFKASKDCTIYAKADSKSTSAGQLKKGQIVKVLGQSGLWSKIAADQWVESKNLTIADKKQAKEKADGILKTFSTAIEGLKGIFTF